jgi:hypothetical protein
MEKRVITELKTNESDAIAKFNNPDGGFRDRDLYVFCFNTTTGIFKAQVKPALMGTETIRDPIPPIPCRKLPTFRASVRPRVVSVITSKRSGD